ncbi:hypothetical protein BP00DRAFT_129426 [Aspergillus indologenus CBS 114.80]|uniref:RING-type domain-containing protein n=1 Tax=Aspergillus indologenus CBS 114.80 TaxID=1450541 RepID=A0A2V5I8M3_9EURO|nr:hypothetical protein BP00DRAFT_129426 [Aspergillus indologenus CBS 114.80]
MHCTSCKSKHTAQGDHRLGLLECKICYQNAVDIVLDCGHPWCFDCFQETFHQYVYRATSGDFAQAKARLNSEDIRPYCPYCRQPTRGFYLSQIGDADEQQEQQNLLYLRCCDKTHKGCFMTKFIVRGTKLRFI